MVKTSADSLLGVINDILDFSKIEAGKLELEAVDFALRDGLGDMMKALALRATQKGLELACHIAPDVPDALVGDPGRLRQIVVNLVGNAIKFTEQRRSDRRTSKVESATNADGRCVCLCISKVRDTGIGIPAEKLRADLRAFTQADNSTTRRYGGTGLGLTISPQLVELMGGRIWVESEVGRRQHLPFHRPFRTVHGADAAPAASGRRPARLARAGRGRQRHQPPHPRAKCCRWGMRRRRRTAARRRWRRWRKRPRPASRSPWCYSMVTCRAWTASTLAEQIRRRPELAGVTLMMLLVGRPCGGTCGRCRQLGIGAYLMKPVKQSELLDAILTALSRPVAPAPSRPRRPAPSRRRSRFAGCASCWPKTTRSTRRWPSRLLEKQGHTVVVANNGREALAALERQSFDLVLMDVQMPEMDGFEATADIRAARRRPAAAGCRSSP